ncbi:MAG: hypothetical protein ACTH5B_03545 [Marinomonas sp.]|uniref:hypothetical protein n=1 Tax=Marinomonas sp. TaxID=1904862 RepID=UPI003F9E5D0A
MLEIILWILVILMTPYLFVVTKGFVRWTLETLFPTKTVTLSYTDKNGDNYTEKLSLDDERLDEILDLIRKERKCKQSNSQ